MHDGNAFDVMPKNGLLRSDSNQWLHGHEFDAIPSVHYMDMQNAMGRSEYTWEIEVFRSWRYGKLGRYGNMALVCLNSLAAPVGELLLAETDC